MPPIIEPAGMVNVLPPLVTDITELPRLMPLRFTLQLRMSPAELPVQLAVYVFEP